MNMFSRSWDLAKASWGVLRQDKELVLLPLISAVASLVILAPFAAGIFFTGRTTGVTSTGVGWEWTPASIALTAVTYLVATYVTLFFQAALICGANERLAGGNPTLGSALAGAVARAGHILPWAILSATVSVVLRAIQERAGFIGRIVVGLIGIAWTLVTFLVLPIIVVEGTGVKDALTRSAEAFKRTWGENVIGNAGIGLVSMLGMLIGLAVTVPMMVLGFGNDMVLLGVAGVALLVVWMLIVSLFTSALTGVYRTALYRYAVAGQVSDGFTADQIQNAFRPRRGMGRFGA